MNLMKKLLTGLLVLSLLFCVCACAGENPVSEDSSAVAPESSLPEQSEPVTDPEPQTGFTVKVVDADGNPVPGVLVQMCKDSCVPSPTDVNGVATFSTIETSDGYKLSVMSCPAGYVYTGEAEIYLESGLTEYTLEIEKEA